MSFREIEDRVKISGNKQQVKSNMYYSVFLNRRFTKLWFDRTVYALLFLTGVQLVLGKSLLTAFFG